MALGRILRITTGCLLVGIGVLGLLMPIMPGWLLIIPGIILLGVRKSHLKKLLDSAQRRFPGHDEFFERLRSRLDKQQHSP